MSACDNCGNDDIWGRREERRAGRPHELIWLCRPCRLTLQDRPLPARIERHPIDYLPLARLAAAAVVAVSAILAIGAHW